MANPAAAPESKPWEGGELLFAGGTDWATLGRSSGKQKKKEDDSQREAMYPTLLTPTRIKNLMGVKIMWVGTGCAACHCVAGDIDGRLYTWGRNEKGQLGHGDLVQRNMPTVVNGLSNVLGGASGRHHTIVFTKSGESYGFGMNTQGQLGLGAVKAKGKADEIFKSPVKASVQNVSAVACGVDFSVWLCEGRVFTAGNPQYGQTGDGSDHLYNAKESSVQLMHDPQPLPKAVMGLNEFKITKIAAGSNHCVVVDDQGHCWTWGNGGYGRLGHKIQKDEFAPKRVETLQARLAVAKDPVISAGSTSSFCTVTGGQLFGWGKLKTSGDNFMYPYPMYDLQGWNVRSMACGPNTYAIAADYSVIIWGQAVAGELGYGPDGKKSSANPDKCNALETWHTHQVGAGLGWSLFLVDPVNKDGKTLDKFPVFENTIEESAPDSEEGTDAPVGKPAKGAKGRGGKTTAAAKKEPAASGKRKAEAAPAPAARGRGKKAK